MKLLSLLRCLLPLVASAKNAGDLLEQYLAKPTEVATMEVLGLVEVTDVEVEKDPSNRWKQTGILYLRTIESVGGKLPATFSVRFYQRGGEGIDAWTWDYTTLKKGKKLLGFFNQWDKANWAVRSDGRTHVISNVEKIDAELLKKVQPYFKQPLGSVAPASER